MLPSLAGSGEEWLEEGPRCISIAAIVLGLWKIQWSWSWHSGLLTGAQRTPTMPFVSGQLWESKWWGNLCCLNQDWLWEGSWGPSLRSRTWGCPQRICHPWSVSQPPHPHTLTALAPAPYTCSLGHSNNCKKIFHKKSSGVPAGIFGPWFRWGHGLHNFRVMKTGKLEESSDFSSWSPTSKPDLREL